MLQQGQREGRKEGEDDGGEGGARKGGAKTSAHCIAAMVVFLALDLLRALRPPTLRSVCCCICGISCSMSSSVSPAFTCTPKRNLIVSTPRTEVLVSWVCIARSSEDRQSGPLLRCEAGKRKRQGGRYRGETETQGETIPASAMLDAEKEGLTATRAAREKSRDARLTCVPSASSARDLGCQGS
eukprot:93754-Rhodomonas_salina.1